MALEDLQSLHGPYNKKGEKGTGEIRDTLAQENAVGLKAMASKYGGSEKPGAKPTGPDPLGNIPPERSFE